MRIHFVVHEVFEALQKSANYAPAWAGGETSETSVFCEPPPLRAGR